MAEQQQAERLAAWDQRMREFLNNHLERVYPTEDEIAATHEWMERSDWTVGYDTGYAAAQARTAEWAARCERLRVAIIADLDFYDWYLSTDAEDVVANIDRRRAEVLAILRQALEGQDG